MRLRGKRNDAAAARGLSLLLLRARSRLLVHRALESVRRKKKDFSKNVFFFLKNPLIFFSLSLKFPNDFRPLSFSLVYFAPSRARDGNL